MKNLKKLIFSFIAGGAFLTLATPAVAGIVAGTIEERYPTCDKESGCCYRRAYNNGYIGCYVNCGHGEHYTEGITEYGCGGYIEDQPVWSD